MATPALAVQNYFSTTLSSSISASDTNIPLNAVPSGQEGFLVIEPDNTSNREVIYFTSKTVNSVVCPSVGAGRGQDNTSAVSHSSGATVVMYITSGHINALMDGTAIDDGAVLPRHLASGTGTTWAWQSWTPTWTNITVGNGTVTALYTQIGKTVHCYLMFVLGSTSSVGSDPTFTLPVTAASRYGTRTHAIGSAYVEDAGVNAFDAVARIAASTTVGEVRVKGAGGTYVSNTGLTATVPFTWGTNDYLQATFTYEAA